MKVISLSKNKDCLVDDDWFEELNKHKWTYMKGYAIRYIGGRKNKKCIYMHRLIANTPDEMITDHIDRNTLNNQSVNLRVVDKSQNMANSKISTRNTSGVKGVCFTTNTGYYKDKKYKYQIWSAQITINGKKKSLGKFKNMEDAVSARKQAERRYWI